MKALVVLAGAVVLAGCAHEARVSRWEVAGLGIEHDQVVMSATPSADVPAPFDGPMAYRRYQIDTGVVVDDRTESLVHSVREVR